MSYLPLTTDSGGGCAPLLSESTFSSKTGPAKPELLVEKISKVSASVEPPPTLLEDSANLGALPVLKLQKEEALESRVLSGDLAQVALSFDSASEQEKTNAFCKAISSRNSEMVRFFLAQGVSIYQPDSLGYIPLHLAIATAPRIAMMICTELSEIRDEHALSYAVYYHQLALIPLLLEKTREIPALLEVIARETLKGTNKTRKISRADLLQSLFIGFQTVPYNLVRAILHDYKVCIREEDIYKLYSIAFMKKDPALLQMLRTNFPKHEEGARNYYSLKWISHSIGIGGQYQIFGKAYSVEGLFNLFGVMKFKEYVREHIDRKEAFQVFHQRTIPALKTGILDAIERFHEGPRTIGKIIEDIQAGKPEIFMTGYKAHSVTYVFCGSMLIVCNRGGDCITGPGLNIYSYDPQNMTPTVIKDLLTDMSNSFEELDIIQALLDIPNTLKANYVTNISMKGQKFGICNWSSMKAAYHGLIIALKYGKLSPKDWIPRVKTKRHQARHRRAYKSFSRFTREKVYKDDYIPFSISPSKCNIDNKGVITWGVDPAFNYVASQKLKAKAII